MELITLGGLHLEGSNFTRPKPLLLVAYLCIEGPRSRRDLAELLWSNVKDPLQGLRTALKQLNQDAPGSIRVEGNRISSELPCDFNRLNQNLSNGQFNEVIQLYQGLFLEGIDLTDPGVELEEWVFNQREKAARTVQQALITLAEHDAAQRSFKRAAEKARKAYYLRFAPEPEGLALSRMYTLLRAAQDTLALDLVKEALLENQDLDLSPEEAKDLLTSQKEILPIPNNPYKGLFAFQETDAEFYFGRETATETILQRLKQAPYIVAIIGSSGSGKSSLMLAGVIPKLRQNPEHLIISLRPGGDVFFNLVKALNGYLPANKTSNLDLRALSEDLRNQHIQLKDLLKQIIESNPGRKLILAFDQFEELSTLNKTQQSNRSELPGELSELLRDLFSLSTVFDEKLATIFTLRADYIGILLNSLSPLQALQNAQLLLGPMPENNLRRVIEEPAKKQGVHFEPGLVDRILGDLHSHAGSLPLLEFTLTQLWHLQQNGLLSHESYEQIGRVQQSIARHAENIIKQLNPDEILHVKHILLQLINPGIGHEDTTRVGTYRELQSQWHLVEKLASYPARLLTIGVNAQGEQTAEIIHEALIQNWERLRSWINEQRAFRTWQERFRQNLQLWQKEQTDAALLQAYHLEEAIQMLQNQNASLSPTEILYIEKSIEQRDKQLKKEQTQREHQLETLQQLADEEKARRHAESARARVQTIATRFIAVLGVIAIVFASVSYVARNQAIAARNESEQQREVSSNVLAELLSNRAINEYRLHPEHSLLLALEAHQNATLSKNRQATETVLRQLTSELGGQRLSHNDRVLVASFSPDGKHLLTTSNDSILKLWKVDEFQENSEEALTAQYSFDGQQGIIFSAKFSPDGKWLATASEDGRVRLWESTSLLTGNPAPVFTLDIHEKEAFALDFSPDSQMLAVGSWDHKASLWELNEAGWQLSSISPDFSRPVSSLAFSQDGKQIAVGTGLDGKNPGQLLIFTSNSFSTQPFILDEGRAIRSLRFSPDGNWLAAGDEQSQIRLWDRNKLTHPDNEALILTGHEDYVMGIAFSPDGRWMASTSRDKTARLWMIQDANHHQSIRHITLRGHEHRLSEGIDFSPDSRWLATASLDQSARIWDLSYPGPDLRVLPQVVAARTIALSSDNRWLALGNLDGEVILHDMQDLASSPRVIGQHDMHVESLAFSSDNAWLASSSGATEDTAATVYRWHLGSITNNPEPEIIQPPEGSVFDVAFSSASDVLALASENATAIVVENSQPFAPVATLNGHQALVTEVAFNPTGNILATASFDEKVRLWNMQDLQQAPTLMSNHEEGVRALAFHPDGQHLASADLLGRVNIWEVSSPENQPRTLEIGDQLIWSIAYSHDGEQLAISDSNQEITLWNSNNEIIKLKGHQGIVWSVAYSYDGNWLISASNDGSIRFWPLDVNKILEQACRKAGRNLSKNEWESIFFGITQRSTCAGFPLGQ